MTEEELHQQLEEYQRSRDELLAEKNKLEAILSSMAEGVTIQDRDYRIIYQNPYYLRMFGEKVGQYCYEVYGKRSEVCDGCPVAMAFADGGVHVVEREVAFPEGRRSFEITASPLRDGSGAIIGGVEVVREVTEHKRHDEEIQRLNAELELRVAERTRQLSEANQALEAEVRQHTAAQLEISCLNEDLQRRSQALESINRELEAFSYSVSHDLRTPLRHIEGFSRLLMEECADRLDQHGMDYLNRVCRSSSRMSMLIDDLLNLSRVTRGEMHLKQVDLTRLAREVVAELRESAPERQATFRIQEGMTAWGDPLLLRVMLVNLLGNAWKYTSKTEAPLIEFGCQAGACDRVWFVRDNGVGFDMAYADRLFGTFQRLHHASDFEGSGIGLATVQRIVNRHQGKVWGEGEVGSGATFYFTLPEPPSKEPRRDSQLSA